MKTITLQKAHELLMDCSAVIWEDNFLSYANPDDLNGKDDNEFLSLSCTDEEGQVFEASFNEGQNREIVIIGSTMFLTDTNGDEVEISLLNSIDIESRV